MSTESADAQGPQTLPAMLREALLRRRTGKLAVEVGGSERSFFFVGGDLYLSRDHALAKATGAPGAGTSPEEGWIEKVLDYFDALGAPNHHFTEGTAEISTDLVGPISTATLVMTGSVRGRDEFQLLRSLGGEEVEVVAYRDSSLAGEVDLDPEEAFLLSRLERPIAIKDLMRQPGLVSAEVVRRLCRLAAVGLIGPHRRYETSGRGSLLSSKLLERFNARIAEELDRDPLSLEPEEHRKKLAHLMARLGGMNYYELLGVSVGSSADEIHAAYTRLARLVHPRHAAALGLGGREAGVDLLFERATEAYLTLSDQDRRGQYLRDVGAFSEGGMFAPSEEKRKEEVEELAARNFRMAQGLVSRQDYYYAIELLNQAIRMEARSEYFALLGHCQSQNPQWYDKAIASYGRAVQLSPEDSDLRVNLGAIYEKTGHRARARVEYQAALAILPGHSGAVSGLHRIESTAEAKPESSPWWKKILGSSRSG